MPPPSSSSSRPRAAEVEANGEEAAEASESRFAGELDARAAAAAVECRSSAIAAGGGQVREGSGSVPVFSVQCRDFSFAACPSGKRSHEHAQQKGHEKRQN